MDPEAALARLRLLAEEPATEENFEEFRMTFQGLDDWLSRNGFLPKGWWQKDESDERPAPDFARKIGSGDLDLAAIRARAEAATEGPWRAAEQTHGDWVGVQDNYSALGRFGAPADAEFIAHARTDVPALLAEVERLARWKAEADLAAAREALARVEALVEEYEQSDGTISHRLAGRRFRAALALTDCPIHPLAEPGGEPPC